MKKFYIKIANKYTITLFIVLLLYYMFYSLTGILSYKNINSKILEETSLKISQKKASEVIKLAEALIEQDAEKYLYIEQKYFNNLEKEIIRLKLEEFGHIKIENKEFIIVKHPDNILKLQKFIELIRLEKFDYLMKKYNLISNDK